MKYDSLRYIYPCRPANSVSPDDLNFWDNQSMLAQLKFNGSNTSIFTNGDTLRIMGRHNQLLTNFQISREEIIESLYKPLNINGNWLVLNGETLNKSKLDERGITFNQKFILFDILVFDSNYLVGKTFQERVNILDDIYGEKESSKEYLYRISENIFRAKSYYSDFKKLFDNYTRIDLIEGLVLKRKNSKLEIASGEKNNWRSQIKSRKPTKLYKY
jgi:ATP-dependent DNA ligase